MLRRKSRSLWFSLLLLLLLFSTDHQSDVTTVPIIRCGLFFAFLGATPPTGCRAPISLGTAVVSGSTAIIGILFIDRIPRHRCTAADTRFLRPFRCGAGFFSIVVVSPSSPTL